MPRRVRAFYVRPRESRARAVGLAPAPPVLLLASVLGLEPGAVQGRGPGAAEALPATRRSTIALVLLAYGVTAALGAALRRHGIIVLI
jgi:hypothetical protein